MSCKNLLLLYHEYNKKYTNDNNYNNFSYDCEMLIGMYNTIHIFDNRKN